MSSSAARCASCCTSKALDASPPTRARSARKRSSAARALSLGSPCSSLAAAGFVAPRSSFARAPIPAFS
ncbi:MAG: hypothetical protein IPF99_14225 [Deltaproteobacteria bacterium]|nr:hypothetical protein [Deltaproteobacteria bacterium]